MLAGGAVVMLSNDVRNVLGSWILLVIFNAQWLGTLQLHHQMTSTMVLTTHPCLEICAVSIMLVFNFCSQYKLFYFLYYLLIKSTEPKRYDVVSPDSLNNAGHKNEERPPPLSFKRV
jgi:hypothetical protein